MQFKIFLLLAVVALMAGQAAAELCKIIAVYAQAKTWTDVDLECPAGSGKVEYTSLHGQWSTGDMVDIKGVI